MTAVVYPHNDDYPYSAMVYIVAAFPNGNVATGSGVMVGVNDVLTASHIVYSAADGGPAASVSVYPGYNYGVAPFGQYVTSSFGYWSVDPDGDGFVTQQESQLDVAILNLNVRLGDITGYLNIEQRGTQGNYDLTGYPGIYSGQMTNDSGFAIPNTRYWVFDYIDVESYPGNSGGPLWHLIGNQPYVVGVHSTGGWAADVTNTYSQIATWIQNNNYLIAGQSFRDPVAIVYDQMYGFSVTEAQLSGLQSYKQDQLIYGLNLGVPDPVLYLYEALGQSFSQGSAFQSAFSTNIIQNDTVFATEAWKDIFKSAPHPDMVDYITKHVDFYETIYAASGGYGSDPIYIAMLARGATYGLILGYADQVGLPVNSFAVSDVSLIGISQDPDVVLAG